MTVENITMPQLGESVTEGTISKWFVSVGDRVNKYDPIAEVMTDKVNAEIPSSFSGVVKELIAKEGDSLAVGEVICTMAVEEIKVQTQPVITPSPSDKQAPEREIMKARYSPAVLKLAQIHNIDLGQVHGTGLNGRVTRKDVLKIVETGQIPTQAEEKVEKNPILRPNMDSIMMQREDSTSNRIHSSVTPGDIEIPLSGIRKTIAANMVRSKHEAPHAWMMVEVDVTNLVQYRNSIKEEFKKKEGFSITYFAFFVKAIAQALREFPQMNSMWAGDKIIQKKEINISIAVATETDLFVPVIKNADEKTIKGIAREISELARKVRTNSLGLDDIKGGTFTVNNTGTFGSIQSMGIINYPQAAIVQVESIVKRPVIMDSGYIGIRDMVNICLSLDHRVLDGLICGRFLQHAKENLENMSKETISIY